MSVATQSAPMFSLFLGPAMILIAVSANWASRIFSEPPIGMPMTEAWVGPEWAPIHAKVREVYATAEPATVIGALGVIRIIAEDLPGLGRAVVVRLLPSVPKPEYLHPLPPELLAVVPSVT